MHTGFNRMCNSTFLVMRNVFIAHFFVSCLCPLRMPDVCVWPTLIQHVGARVAVDIKRVSKSNEFHGAHLPFHLFLFWVRDRRLYWNQCRRFGWIPNRKQDTTPTRLIGITTAAEPTTDPANKVATGNLAIRAKRDPN